MEKNILLLISFLIYLTSNSQSLNLKQGHFEKVNTTNDIQIKHASKLSTSCKLFILKLKQRSYELGKKLNNEFITQNSIETYNGIYFIGGLLKVDTEVIDINILDSYGVKVNSKINNIWTVKVPIDQLEKFTNLNGVIFFEKSKKGSRLMDDAKSQTNVDDVHSGTGFNTPYKGDDVVVGIIDGGFDYTHPAFDDNGSQRIKRVWEQQTSAQNFPPPNGFNYGMELTNTTEMLSAQHDAIQNNNGNWVANGSHATHVAGIAAGSDNAINGVYGGCAPNSDLVFNSTNWMADGILDGISYIFDYAASVNKPAVINMSIGTHNGPHDGTSLFDQALTNLTGNGKILVGAGGNEGSDIVHFGYSFPASVDSIPTSVTIDPTNNTTSDDYVTVDAWGSPNKDFCIMIDLFDLNGNWHDYIGGWLCASTNLTDSVILTGSDGGQFGFWFSCEDSSPLNSKPHINYIIEAATNDYITISIAGDDDVNMWITSGQSVKWTDWGLTSALDYQAYPLAPGDNNISVGEIGGTGTNMITVGAYTSKDAWTDNQGSTHQIPFLSSIGDIAPFSSLGPTTDGRIKPDITAPGNILISSVNSFDTENQPGGYSYDRVVSNVGSNNWPYGAMEGTSMATPMVTGIIALLFDINPHLSFNDIKQLIQSTAITDNFTGSAPNNTWGYGKIDALGAAQATTPTSVNQYTSNDIFIYPNPANEFVNIYIPEYISSEKITLFDNLGREVMSLNYSGKLNLNTSSLSQGIYFLEANNNKKIYREKLIIN